MVELSAHQDVQRWENLLERFLCVAANMMLCAPAASTVVMAAGNAVLNEKLAMWDAL